MFAVGLIFSITVSEPSSASQAADPLVILKLGSSTTTITLVAAFVAAETKNKVLANNLHQCSRVGSPEKWAAVSPGISN